MEIQSRKEKEGGERDFWKFLNPSSPNPPRIAWQAVILPSWRLSAGISDFPPRFPNQKGIYSEFGLAVDPINPENLQISGFLRERHYCGYGSGWRSIYALIIPRENFQENFSPKVFCIIGRWSGAHGSGSRIFSRIPQFSPPKKVCMEMDLSPSAEIHGSGSRCSWTGLSESDRGSI